MDFIEDFETPTSANRQADERLNVRFTLEPRPDNAKIEATGEQHYRDVEFVTIFIPGDKTLSVHRPVQASDKIRFREKYQHFKQNLSVPTVGTPLAFWPLVSPAQRQELQYLNCQTVEQLAGMSDTATQSMIGLLTLRTKAQRFLEAQSSQAGANKLTAELAQRDDAIAALQSQLEALAKTVEKSSKGK
jgi:hypothetical protein